MIKCVNDFLINMKKILCFYLPAGMKISAVFWFCPKNAEKIY